MPLTRHAHLMAEVMGLRMVHGLSDAQVERICRDLHRNSPPLFVATWRANDGVRLRLTIDSQEKVISCNQTIKEPAA